jgi:hypothetical protein
VRTSIIVFVGSPARASPVHARRLDPDPASSSSPLPRSRSTDHHRPCPSHRRRSLSSSSRARLVITSSIGLPVRVLRPVARAHAPRVRPWLAPQARAPCLRPVDASRAPRFRSASASRDPGPRGLRTLLIPHPRRSASSSSSCTPSSSLSVLVLIGSEHLTSSLSSFDPRCHRPRRNRTVYRRPRLRPRSIIVGRHSLYM